MTELSPSAISTPSDARFVRRGTAVSKRAPPQTRHLAGWLMLGWTFAQVPGRSRRGHGRAGSVGLLLPNSTAKIVDPDTGRVLGAGEEGELWIKGPNVMKGYLNNAKATAETIDADGYLHTGPSVPRVGHRHPSLERRWLTPRGRPVRSSGRANAGRRRYRPRGRRGLFLHYGSAQGADQVQGVPGRPGGARGASPEPSVGSRRGRRLGPGRGRGRGRLDACDRDGAGWHRG